MFLPLLLVLFLAFASLSSANNFVYNSSDWPPIDGEGASPPPPNSAFASLLPSSFPSTPAVRSKEENPQMGGTCPKTGDNGPNGSCWWTCAEGTDGFPCSTPKDARDCKPGKWGLSYDDGPTNQTNSLLDMLKSKNLKATFCLIGSQVVRFPDETKRIYDEGHDLCVHTWSHSPLTSQTNDVVLAELKYTEMAIEAVTGVRPKYFRPPYGDTDNRIRNIITALGYTQLLWKYDSSDYNAFPDVPKPLSLNDLIVGLNSNVSASWPDGLISLEHAEKAALGVEFAGKLMDTVTGKYEIVPVSTCLDDAAPWISNSNLGGASSEQNSPANPVNPATPVNPTGNTVALSSTAVVVTPLSAFLAVATVLISVFTNLK